MKRYASDGRNIDLRMYLKALLAVLLIVNFGLSAVASDKQKQDKPMKIFIGPKLKPSDSK